MRLGIIFGGNSLEHEISIISAYSIRRKLCDDYDISMLYLDFNNNLFDASRVSLNDFKNDNLRRLKKARFIKGGYNKKKVDCMLLALHGENTEDGTIASICKFYNINYVGSDNFASSISLDKFKSYLYLSSLDIPMVKTTIYSYEDYIEGTRINSFPIIIKPIYGGSSIGIKVCHSISEFDDVIKDVFNVSKTVVIQPYYDNILEYNLAVYENGFSNLERIDKKDEIFSFDNKYNESFKLIHQSINEDYHIDDFKSIARRVYNMLGCSGIIRIDFFLIDNNIYVNEVNILPGGLSMYLFNDFKKVISECINLSLTKSYNVYKRGKFLSNCEINK